jgi:hypothetical protein
VPDGLCVLACPHKAGSFWTLYCKGPAAAGGGWGRGTAYANPGKPRSNLADIALCGLAQFMRYIKLFLMLTPRGLSGILCNVGQDEVYTASEQEFCASGWYQENAADGSWRWFANGGRGEPLTEGVFPDLRLTGFSAS